MEMNDEDVNEMFQIILDYEQNHDNSLVLLKNFVDLLQVVNKYLLLLEYLLKFDPKFELLMVAFSSLKLQLVCHQQQYYANHHIQCYRVHFLRDVLHHQRVCMA